MRAAAEIMADLALSELDPEQLALVMELSAALGREGAPARSKAAARQQKYRDRKRNEPSQNVTDRNEPSQSDDDEKEKSPQTPLKEKPPSPKGDIPPFKIDQFIEDWNKLAAKKGLAKVEKITKSRRAAYRQRLADHDPEDFAKVLRSIEQSKFHCGDNDRGWKADFDWVLCPKNFVKRLEACSGEPDVSPTLPPDLETRWLGICAKHERGEIDRKAYDEQVKAIYAEATERRQEPKSTGPPPAIAKLIHQATR